MSIANVRLTTALMTKRALKADSRPTPTSKGVTVAVYTSAMHVVRSQYDTHFERGLRRPPRVLRRCARRWLTSLTKRALRLASSPAERLLVASRALSRSL